MMNSVLGARHSSGAIMSNDKTRHRVARPQP
jgi:hypothetical protein